MSWARQVYRALDRPLGRGVLGVLGTIKESGRTGERRSVRYEDGLWVHRSRQGIIPHGRIGAPTPKAWDADARDVFCHHYTPREGDVVLDIGAGVGSETLSFSRMVGPNGRVHAIEAHPRTFALLRTLCDLNRLDNVVPAQLAVSDRAGILRISDEERSVVNRLVSETAPGLDVPAVTLDAYVRDQRIDRIDFVKMNIEGAERFALPGMIESIGRVRHLCIGCHDFLADAPGGDPAMRTSAFVRAFLEERGFSVTSRPEDPRPWVRWYLYAER